jgi:16S rRNA A1518/A1519 N6-dimethyltransferase RsmA/KsgA/DIM1 with predicted DNA glycosylase/AP lyase activity
MDNLKQKIVDHLQRKNPNEFEELTETMFQTTLKQLKEAVEELVDDEIIEQYNTASFFDGKSLPPKDIIKVKLILEK